MASKGGDGAPPTIDGARPTVGGARMSTWDVSAETRGTAESTVRTSSTR